MRYSYISLRHVSHVPYTRVSASVYLKKHPPEFKAKEKYQFVILRHKSKNSDTDAIALKYFDANVNTQTHRLQLTSYLMLVIVFLLVFLSKYLWQKIQ